MRPLPVTAALAFLYAGCRESPTSPYHRSTDPAPSGLAVALRTASPSVDSLPGGRPLIAAAGDSIAAAAVLSTTGCEDHTARAGLAGGSLVVTFVLTPSNRV